MQNRILAVTVLAVCGAASAQCSVLLEDTFRLGDRPHGGQGQPRTIEVGDSLGGFWPLSPSGVQWQTASQSWFFAAASADPLEFDPLDPFNGVAFVGASHAAALLPLTPPAGRTTLSAEVAMGLGMNDPIYLGFTSSGALTDNFESFGALWVSLDATGSWRVHANGSGVVVASGVAQLGALEAGWTRIELAYDTATQTASGAVGSSSFGPVAAPLGLARSFVGMEAHGNVFNAVNNLRVWSGEALGVSVSGPGAATPGGTARLTAQASGVAGFAWRRDGAVLRDGPTAWGSVIEGSATGALTISGLAAPDAGAYDCVAFGACGAAASAPVALSFCYANCDNSTTAPALNVLDFSCFLNRFAAGDAYANCDGSTTVPALNVLDFACFLNRFAAGCP